MSADIEERVQSELRAMAAHVELASDSWQIIRGRVASRHRAKQRIRAVTAVVATVLLVGVAIGAPWAGREDDEVRTGVAWSADELRIRDRVPIGSSLLAIDLRVALTSDGSAVWYSRMGTSEVGQVDLVAGRAGEIVDTGALVENLAVSPGAVWALASGAGDVGRIDRETGAVERVSLEVAGSGHAATGGIAYSDRALWVPVRGGGLVRVDIETLAVEIVDLGIDVRFLTAGDGALWGVGDAGTVVRFDPRRRVVTAQTDLGAGDYRIEQGEGAVWVLDRNAAELVELSADLGAQRRISAGVDPHDLAVGVGAVFVTDALDGELIVVDPGSGQVRRSLELGGRPNDVVVAGEEIWVADPDAESLIAVALR